MKSCKYFTPSAESIASFDNVGVSPNIQIELPLQGQNNCSCPSVYSQIPTKVAICPFNTDSQTECSHYEPNPSQLIRVATDQVTETSSEMTVFVCLSVTRGKFGFVQYEIHSGRHSNSDGIVELNLLISCSRNSLVESFDYRQEDNWATFCHGSTPHRTVSGIIQIADHKEVVSLYNHFCEVNGCISRHLNPRAIKELFEVFAQTPDKFIDKLLSNQVQGANTNTDTAELPW